MLTRIALAIQDVLSAAALRERVRHFVTDNLHRVCVARIVANIIAKRYLVPNGVRLGRDRSILRAFVFATADVIYARSGNSGEEAVCLIGKTILPAPW